MKFANMKFTSAIAIAVLSYTANSAAIPADVPATDAATTDAAPQEWYLWIGAYGPAKRDAEPWCEYVGQPC